MKNNMRTIIILLVSNVLLFICSCTNESVTQSAEIKRIIGHLDDGSRTLFVSNDNITDTHWVVDDSIGLFTQKQQNVLYTALNEGKNTEFRADEAELIFNENTKVIAYYPFTDSIKDNKIKLPITTKIKSSESPVSFMYSNSYASNDELNLYFNHLYAYLQIKISTNTFVDKVASLPEDYYKTEGIFLNISSSEYISTSNAWFDTDSYEIFYNEKDASKRLYFYCENIDFNVSDTLIYMIPILPQPEGAIFNINISFPAYLDGYVWPYVILSDKKVPLGGFLAGHVYTINTVDNIKPSSEQYKLLEDFYNSTNGNLWRNNKNWLTDTPLKEWYGLNDGDINNTYVNKIKLNRNILTGTLPNSFVKLMDCAQDIDLGFNGMSGEIPNVIKEHERWKEIGWNIVSQDTRLSNGFNLTKSNLFLSNFDITNILDSCTINLEEILSKNELTQIIWHCPPYSIEDVRNYFTESHVNLHLKYSTKGLGTILLIQSDFENNIQREFIKKTYGEIKSLKWGKALTYPDNSMYYGMSYLFNSEGELVYFAPYYYEPYIYHEFLKPNDVVHEKLDLFIKNILGDPDEHEEFKFKE